MMDTLITMRDDLRYPVVPSINLHSPRMLSDTHQSTAAVDVAQVWGQARVAAGVMHLGGESNSQPYVDIAHVWKETMRDVAHCCAYRPGLTLLNCAHWAPLLELQQKRIATDMAVTNTEYGWHVVRPWQAEDYVFVLPPRNSSSASSA